MAIVLEIFHVLEDLIKINSLGFVKNVVIFVLVVGTVKSVMNVQLVSMLLG